MRNLTVGLILSFASCLAGCQKVSEFLNGRPEAVKPPELGSGGASSTQGKSTVVGYLDAVNSETGGLYGWAINPAAPAEFVEVHFYVDDPTGTRAESHVGSATADQPRPDVARAQGYRSECGFVFNLPDRYRDGGEHELHAFAVLKGIQGKFPLSGSPKPFRMAR